MSDLWNKMKGIFVVEVNTTTAVTAAPNISNASESAMPETINRGISPAILVNNGIVAVNEKFMEVLFGALEKANLPGFDYLEFKQALSQLATMPMDEATRYKSAYAMAQTMGVTAEKLVNTALHYLDVLKQEEGKFRQTADAQRLSQIDGRNATIKSLGDIIQQKEAQIKKLTEEINAHKQQFEQTQSEMAQAESKMNQTKADFAAAQNAIINQIQMDITNMKNYLK